MIKPMIDPSFSDYGVVERFRREPDHTLNHIPIFDQTDVPIYCFPFPTSWDYVDGMTVLLILDGSTRKRYYLDRAVTIHPGVCFCFYPLGQTSTVAGDAAIMTPEACTDVLNLSEELPDKHQMHIFTLFRQVGQDGLFFRGEHR